MRILPLVLVLAVGCGTAGEPPAHPERPTAAPEAALVDDTAPEDEEQDFFLGADVSLDDVVAWDTTTQARDRMRLTNLQACWETCDTNTAGTTFCYTTCQDTVDADSDGVGAYKDCDDNNSSIYPGATEYPADGVDQDCDGKELCYADLDGDGYGDPTAALVLSSDLTCMTGAVAPNKSDCMDVAGPGDVAAEDVHPGATEVCNGIDDDCDGLVDDDDDSLEGAPTWYLDADGDGFGAGAGVEACLPPSLDHVKNALDCDDTDDTVHPGAEERDNGLDDDCDDEVDEGLDGPPDDTDDPGPTDDTDDPAKGDDTDDPAKGDDTDAPSGGDDTDVGGGPTDTDTDLPEDGGCGGCQSTGGAGGGLSLALGALGGLFLRRRR